MLSMRYVHDFGVIVQIPKYFATFLQGFLYVWHLTEIDKSYCSVLPDLTVKLSMWEPRLGFVIRGKYLALKVNVLLVNGYELCNYRIRAFWFRSPSVFSTTCLVEFSHFYVRFLWRKNASFAISRHYRRYDVFVEADANKAASKFDNASIDFQVDFYRKEGLTPYTRAKLPISSG